MTLTIELVDRPESAANVLAVFAFGGQHDEAINHAGLMPPGDSPVYEIWRTSQAVTHGQLNGLSWRATPDLLFGSIDVSLAVNLVETTRTLYHQVLVQIRNLGYPNLLRAWNFMPRINEGRGDSENYKSFSLGRALALDEGGADQALLPAATAVGSRSGDRLLVYFLATREPGSRLENPRQVSAFDYPRPYGPRSPMFSRAAIFSFAGQSLLLVSGTASIVGHESRHAGDLPGQIEETCHNLKSVCSAAGETHAQIIRVYIRRDVDYPHVRRLLAGRFPDNVPILYLFADICRTELLVEIEGIYEIVGNPHE